MGANCDRPYSTTVHRMIAKASLRVSRATQLLNSNNNALRYLSADAQGHHGAKPKPGGLDEQQFRLLTEKISPFMQNFMKPEIVTIDRGHLEMKLPFRPDFVGNPIIPCLHGGVTAALIDHVGGFCAWTMLDDPNQLVNTVDLRIDYLVPAPCEDMFCSAVLSHKGSKLIRTDIVCWNKNKTVKIAIGRGLYNIYSMPTDIPSLMRKAHEKGLLAK